ncbi:SUEL-type lectin domain-containing protein [Plasmodiophora brassicae]
MNVAVFIGAVCVLSHLAHAAVVISAPVHPSYGNIVVRSSPCLSNAISNLTGWLHIPSFMSAKMDRPILSIWVPGQPAPLLTMVFVPGGTIRIAYGQASIETSPVPSDRWVSFSVTLSTAALLFAMPDSSAAPQVAMPITFDPIPLVSIVAGASDASNPLSMAGYIGHLTCSPTAPLPSPDPLPGGHLRATGGTAYPESDPIPFTITCPAPSARIADIAFASFGHPQGTYPTYSVDPSCHAPSSMDVARAACLHRHQCQVPYTPASYAPLTCTDPLQWLSVVVVCRAAPLMGSAAPTTRTTLLRATARQTTPLSPSPYAHAVVMDAAASASLGSDIESIGDVTGTGLTPNVVLVVVFSFASLIVVGFIMRTMFLMGRGDATASEQVQHQRLQDADRAPGPVELHVNVSPSSAASPSSGPSPSPRQAKPTFVFPGRRPPSFALTHDSAKTVDWDAMTMASDQTIGDAVQQQQKQQQQQQHLVDRTIDWKVLTMSDDEPKRQTKDVKAAGGTARRARSPRPCAHAAATVSNDDADCSDFDVFGTIAAMTDTDDKDGDTDRRQKAARWEASTGLAPADVAIASSPSGARAPIVKGMAKPAVARRPPPRTGLAAASDADVSDLDNDMT